ncbi:MAG: thermonuclease family protein [Candidatus Aminicenantes bacterium]|nr:thermonuclease family protein [Candidatus Aminicenantes bacterium]MDH5715366.1 thermonuclease family protein [Candidatus Aminicenantes bacterium]
MYLTDRIIVLSLLIASLLGYFCCSPRGEEAGYRLMKVIDGDTVQLRTPVGEVIMVRYIGIDCPERGEPFYYFALKTNRNLLKGKRIILKFDEKLHDTYGRWLAYVYADEMMVNAELVRLGCARLYLDSENEKHLSLFKKMLEEAQRHHRGLWER